MTSADEHPYFADVTLDAGRTMCGDLVLMIVQQMRTLDSGRILHVVGYDRGALEDIPAWCRMTHNLLVHQVISENSSEPSHFYIQKR